MKRGTSYYAGAAPADAANRIQYAAHGAIGAMKLGNGKWEHTLFNGRLQPTEIGLGATSGASDLLKLEYKYGVLVNNVLDTTKNNGNIQSQIITAPKTQPGNLVLTQNYTYDALNRLNIAEEFISATSQWKQTYDIDRFGNRAIRSSSYILPRNANQTPQSANGTDFSAFNQNTNRIALGGFDYDTSGNLKADPTTGANGIVYDAENRQTSYTKSGATTSYSYDGDGRRVKRTDPDNTTTIFVYNVVGQLIAEYTSGPPSGGGTSYLTSDHLGSTRVVTSAADGSGNVTVKARYDYLPFGEEIGSDRGSRSLVTGYATSDKTRQKFTQKERDAESGLDYFLARYYSSAQGRFTSPDEFAGGPDELFDFADDASDNPTFYADIYEPQSLNKYQYCYNNPLAYVDPDGHGVRFKRKNAPGGSATVLGAALTEAAQSPIPNPAVGAAVIVVGIGAMILDWWTHRSDQDSDSKDKSGPPPASDAQTQPQTQTQPAAPPGGGKDSRKVNRKREQSAKEKAEELKTQRDELRSKPNKTPEDKINLQKIESALKKQLERVKKSEPHSRRPKGYRGIVPVTDAKTKDDQLR